MHSIFERARALARLAGPLPADPLARRDPALIRSQLRTLGPWVETWFAPEYEGWEHLPPGRALVVGTHNGGFLGPDLCSFMVGAWRALGVDRPTYGLAHDVVFRIPLMAGWLSRLGAVPARPDLALALLERDRLLAVYPGGVREAYKPFGERYVVDFFGRMGFLRTAIRGRAPIIPMVSAGAHEAIYVLSDGARAAHALGLDASLRVDALPLQLCLPWGLAVGPVPYLPAPCKVRIRLLPPIELGLPPEAADDPDQLAEAYRHVVAVMQAGLDELVAQGGVGVRARLRAWRAARATARGPGPGSSSSGRRPGRG